MKDMDYEVWTCKDRSRMAVYQMGDSHLMACILKIKHSHNLWRVDYLPRLEREMRTRYLTMEDYLNGKSITKRQG